MNEARTIAVERDVEQNRTIEKLEARIRDIENNRALERQIADLQVSVTGRLTAVETALQGLQGGRRR